MITVTFANHSLWSTLFFPSYLTYSSQNPMRLGSNLHIHYPVGDYKDVLGSLYLYTLYSNNSTEYDTRGFVYLHMDSCKVIK
jgi:hypothetical protein